MIAHARAVHELQVAGWPSSRAGFGALARLYRDGMFGLKLAGSACIGAAVTMAIMNNLDNDPGLLRLQPERYAPGFHRPELVRKDGASLLADGDADRAIPFPRPVKTLRFYDTRPQNGGPSVATLNSGRVLTDFKANGTWLEDMKRADGSLKLRIPLRGSLQNPAWSPDGKLMAFTRFRNGYNKGPADVYVFNLETSALQAVASDGSNNISQPGSTWTRDGQIVFSSDRSGHDEVWMAGADGSRPRKLTSRASQVAYEPSLSPDSQSLVFESNHPDGKKSRVTMFEISENRYTDLTPADEDCRQPNWSPRGDYVVYQKYAKGRWDLWLLDMKTRQHRQVTTAGGSTDATFSPDGRFLLYSGEGSGDDGAALMALSVEGGRPFPMTRGRGYHGAPSWSPDGAYVAMESSQRDPDGTVTELLITPVRKELTQLFSGSR